MWTCLVLRSDEYIELRESDKVYNDKYFGEMRDSYKNKAAAEGPNASFTRITNGEVECFSRNTKLALLLTEHSTKMLSWERSTTKLQNQSQLTTGMERPL